MKKRFYAVAVLSMAGCMCCKESSKDSPIGNWSVMLPYGSMSAGSIILSQDGGESKSLTLWRWGSPEWCREVKIDGSRFSFVHPYGQVFEGTVRGDRLYGRIAPCDWKTSKVTGPWQPFEGYRNLEIPEDVKTSDARFGEPIDLLKDGLKGWESMDPNAKFGWSFKDGVLSNCLGLKPDGSWAGGGANLMSKIRDFYDFNLEYDVRIPKKSNSGVYLRGRFEIQVVDSYGQSANRHGMAAYYGRKAPTVSAEKPAGE